MPTRLQQNEYLFKTCKDVFTQGLQKARPVGPERGMAFTAGYIFGKAQQLLVQMQQGRFEPPLLEAFSAGVEAGTKNFEPPTWSLGPFTPQPDLPDDDDLDD